MASPKPLRIWSFDGGGKGVLSQLVITDKLMRLIQWKQKLSEVPNPSDYADIMIGTGLGGVAAVLMGRLRLSASETYDEIVQLGGATFGNEPRTHSLAKPFNLATLKSALSKILIRHGFNENTVMVEDRSGEKQCRVIVLASSKADVTTSRRLRTYGSPMNINCTIVDAMAATLAVPDWVEPVEINDGLEKHVLIGGSIGYNNPTWEGLLEAKDVFEASARLTSLISIGSGQTAPASPGAQINSEATNPSLKKWMERMVADCDQTARQLVGYFQNTASYIRFAPSGILEDMEIMNWGEHAIDLVSARVASYLDTDHVRKDLERALGNLLEEASSITLGQITRVFAAGAEERSVPRLTPYYVHRPSIYGEMQIHLNEDDTDDQKLLVIHGMGGSGKTQLASFFARTNRRRYKHVFFLDASSAASLRADLQSAIRSLGVTHSSETFEDTLRYLKSKDSGRWLVIFDNADDPNLPLIEFIPSCNHGHIIITSRNHELSFLAPTSHIQMSNMEDTEALSVLCLAAQLPRPETRFDREHGMEACSLVGNLPLALVQIGSYCQSSKISFAQYLDRYRDHRKRLMGVRPGWQLDRYPHSAYTSISLSYSLLDSTTKSLLHLLSFYHPSSIPVDILCISAKHRFDSDPDFHLFPKEEQRDLRFKDLEGLLMKDGVWDQIHIDELLMRLQSLSLISLGSDDGFTTLSIHPLVQSFVQDFLSAEDFGRFIHMAAITLSGCVWDEDESMFRYLVLHIHEVGSKKLRLHVNDRAAFAYLSSVMILQREALQRWKEIRGECEEKLGKDHESTLYATRLMANCLRELGDYEGAAAEVSRVVAVQERELGVDHDKTLQSYYSLALNHQYQRKFQDAEAVFRNNLRILERKYGGEHGETLTIASWLGLNLYEQERFTEAEAILRRTVASMKRASTDETIATSLAIHRLSRVLIKLEKWEEAESLLQNVVQWRKATFGEESEYTLVVLRDLAACSQHRGDVEAAKGIQRHVLEVTEKKGGLDQVPIVVARNAMEETLEMTNQDKSKGEGDVDTKDNVDNASRTGVWERHMVEFVLVAALVAFFALLFPIVRQIDVL